MSTFNFLAFLFPTGVGTKGGAVSSAIISRLTGISAVLVAYCCFSFLAQEKRSAADAIKNTDLRIVGFIILNIIILVLEVLILNIAFLIYFLQNSGIILFGI